MKLIIGFASLALFATTAASAEDAQPAKPPEEKKICRTERSTGSLTRRTRICMTRAEWDEMSRQTKKDVDQMSNNAGRIAPPSNGGS